MSDTLRLWSIQPLEVWSRLRAERVLFVDPEILDEFFVPAYDWMRRQMAQRLPRYEGHYPWWAYEHKLDLRFYRYHHGTFGERWVRLELAAPQAEVLLSAYGDWHAVLNRWYLPSDPDSEAEWEAVTDEALMEASWERIFDVERLRPTNTIQATFERLCLDYVVTVTEFTSMCKST